MRKILLIILLIVADMSATYNVGWAQDFGLPFDFWSSRPTTGIIPMSCLPIDTSRIPLTPYTGGWYYFAGVRQIFTCGNELPSAQFINADSVRIRFRFYRAANSATILMGGAVQSWLINVAANAGNTLNLYDGNSGYKTIFRWQTSTDTSWYAVDLIWHKTDSLCHRYINGADSGTVKFHWNNGGGINTTRKFTIGAFDNTGTNTLTPLFKGGIQYVWLDNWKNGVDSLHRWNFNQAGEYIYDSANYESPISPLLSNSGTLSAGHVLGAADSCEPLFVPDSIHTSKFSAPGYPKVVANYIWALTNNWTAPQIWNMKNCNDTSILCVGVLDRVNADPLHANSGDSCNNVFSYNPTANKFSVFSGGADNNYIENVEPYKNGFTINGPFTSAANIDSTAHLAYYDGNWHSLTPAGKIDQNLRAVYHDGDSLWIGGVFTKVNNQSLSGIAKYNGSAWSGYGTGTAGGEVEDICKFNGSLYICGRFTTANGVTCNHIAKWNGTTFEPLGTGANDVLYRIIVYNNELYAMGAATSFNGQSGMVGAWNGSSWRIVVSTLSGETSGETRIISAGILNNILYLGGSFARTNGAISKHFIQTNGKSVCSIGIPGADGEIWAIVPFGNSLYLGGSFHVLDGIPAQVFGKYTP